MYPLAVSAARRHAAGTLLAVGCRVPNLLVGFDPLRNRREVSQGTPAGTLPHSFLPEGLVVPCPAQITAQLGRYTATNSADVGEPVSRRC